MLFQSLDKIKRDSIMATIFLIFGGIFMLLLPESYIPVTVQALGYVLLVVFILSVFRFMGSRKVLINYIRLFVGLLCGTAGFAFLIFDNLFLYIFHWLVGTIPILIGAYGIFHALTYARRSGRRGWWVLILLSLALFVFGGVAFWNPWVDDLHSLMQVTGGVLLSSAFVSALQIIWIWPIHHNERG